MITTDQVLEALKGILYDGLHLIEASSSLSFCKLEGYHLHNVPALLLKPSRGPIHYYFTIERPEYLAKLSAAERVKSEQRYGDHWRILEEYLSQEE